VKEVGFVVGNSLDTGTRNGLESGFGAADIGLQALDVGWEAVDDGFLSEDG